jgi:Fe-Mn family superoxide dismutase
MKVSISYVDKEYKKNKELVDKFCNFLQKEFPLKTEFKIAFLPKRVGGMTTGSRNDESLLKILTKGRMNRDILRTLAHEWVHEYQRKVLKRKHGPNIGGKNEDEANAEAGKLMKMFEKDNPDLDEKIYESKGIDKKIGLIQEQLLLTEVHGLRKEILTEMKRIGIEDLPYSYSALRKFVDPKTMDIHYNKHYKGYVKKLNNALKKKEGEMSLEEIIKSISKFDDTVRNNGGGAFNHALFWKMLSPKKQIPKGEISKKIKEDFGNIKKLKDEFNETAKTRFGSGWAWLVLDKSNKLKIMSTPNQDNPLMDVVKGGGYPILGLDVWEHAYYLKYQNKRDEYISKFWDHVNWEFVEELYKSRTEKKNIKESVDVKKILKEARSTNTFPLTPKQIRELIHSQYVGCYNQQYKNGCIGRLQTKKCSTDLGILGGDFSEKKHGGTSQWSIINRFDTNSRVKSLIQQIWMEETEGKEDLKTWVTEHAYDLFSNDGMYTERLVAPNLGTIIIGKENETFAKKTIREVYNLNPDEEGITYQLYEHCSGDVNDRKKGQDIVLTLKNQEPIFFQVKPFIEGDIQFYDSGDRGYYFKVSSWHRQTKYKGENVDIIMYVDRSTSRYIMFRNDHNRMLTVSNPATVPPFFIYYYEMPLRSNFKLDKKQEPSKIPVKKSIQKDTEKEIEFYKERLQYFKDKLNDLGVSDSITEMVEYYKTKIQKIIIE